MRYLQWIAVLVATMAPVCTYADAISLPDLTMGDYDKIVKEFSSDFAYSTVTPASSLGGLWGFEIGAVGGITKTPELQALVKRSGSSSKTDKMPHGGVLLRVGVPFGLTAEALVIPKKKFSDLTISEYSGAAQWTITDIFFTELPVTLAVKGFLSKTSLGYKQRLNNSTTGNQPVDANIDFDNTIMGAQFLVSKKLFVFEPYVGIGYAKAKGKLSVAAALAPNASLFPGMGNSSSATSSPTSAQLIAGLDFRVFFLSLGAEYQKAFGTSGATGRLSFRF